MTQVLKIDSNITGLRFAEESSIGEVDSNAIWYPAEPNSYSGFGGKLKTVARNPINPSRQRKKGVVVDLDAAGSFVQDWTQTNLQRLMQGFMFADFREKKDTQAFNDTAVPLTSITTGPNRYNAASGLAMFRAGALVVATGNTDPGNDGLRHVSASASGYVEVSETLIADAAPADESRLVEVGYQFGSAAVNVDVTGSLPKLVRASATAASRTLTLTGNAGDGETVTIGTVDEQGTPGADIVYTFKTALSAGPTVAYEVFIGATAEDSADNLVAAINQGAGIGTNYSTGTVAHPNVTAADGAGTTVPVTAAVSGANGNNITVATDVTGASWPSATLTAGAGKSMLDFGLVPGEWVFVGGDATNTSFVTDENNGRKRVRSIADSYIEFDKSYTDMANETGTGLTVELFFGRVIKNELGTDIVRRSYQWERTLGAPDDSSPTELQSEYLSGSVANQLDLKFTTADILNATLSFISTDYEQRTADDGLKPGTRPDIPDTDAFNSTSDVKEIKISQIEEGEANPTPLFAHALDITLSIKNNCVGNKAIGVLGAFDVTAGTFEISGKLTAYFSNIEAVQAVRNNADMTIDVHTWKANSGIAIDMPLITLGDGEPDVVQDKPIELPLSMDAATGKKIDTNLDYTLMLVFFDYLPDLAAG